MSENTFSSPRQAQVPDSAAGRRFDAVLAELFPEFSRSRLTEWIKTGAVLLDGEPVRPLHDGERTSRIRPSERGESLVSVRLGTGRSHQIRVQFASRGMPLLGDVKYGSARRDCRIALWSRRLCFAHPLTGQSVDMSVSPPESAPWTDFMYFKKETDNG